MEIYMFEEIWDGMTIESRTQYLQEEIAKLSNLNPTRSLLFTSSTSTDELITGAVNVLTIINQTATGHLDWHAINRFHVMNTAHHHPTTEINYTP